MKIGIFGRGRLGSAIAAAAGADLAWAIGRDGAAGATPDVVVDAGAAEAVESHVAWCVRRRVPLVIGVTGWRLPDLEARVDGRIGVVIAPNFSLTVALATRVAAVFARFAALEPRFDPWVAEKHRPTKRDAPSGTARLVAETMLAACPRKTSWRLADGAGAFGPHELSVGVLRAGSGAGELSFGLDAPEETLEVRHAARGPEAYASGALAACRWVLGRTGVFTMDDVARSVLDPIFAAEPSR
ncbi:MAG TPA: dihydrodipicolinate reductase C-terminal domain-containing protein [Planctomycetota bacterium]|nr:dihydrodipicolinate reductase C-terminal domain-containing protein [Planctomycetota bacterium]